MIAAQMIHVPADEIVDATLQAFAILIFVFITSFVVANVLINFLLRRYVIQPIGVLDRLADFARRQRLFLAVSASVKPPHDPIFLPNR